jgi:carboxyl-terminal processing protease
MGRRATFIGGGVLVLGLAAVAALTLAPRVPDGAVLDPIWRTGEVIENAYGRQVTAQVIDGATAAMVAGTGADHEDVTRAAEADDPDSPAAIPAGYEPLWRAWQVAAAGVTARDAPGLVHATVVGMVAATGDPRAQVVVGDYREQNEYFDDEQIGIGAVVSQRGISVVISQPFPGGPADRAGAQPEDVIMSVDGITVDNAGVAAAALRGDVGDEVVVVVRREGVGEVELTIIRDVLPLTSAGMQHLAGEIGYLHITRFAEDTPGLVADRLAELSSRGARGLILDLRGNTTGRPSAAAASADHFLDGGIAYLAEDLDGSLTQFQASPGGIAVSLPMVVIVDDRTGGPAELYAAAIRDNRRAPVLGTPTLGDTALHRPHQIAEDLAVVAFDGRWHAPTGPETMANGLQPDVEVPLLDDDVAAGYDRQMFAAYSFLWRGLGGAVADMPDGIG